MNVITPEEVKKRLDAGEKLHLVDVREPSEHADFNIGGILHPLGRIMGADTDALEDMMHEEVIVYCRSGNRSGNACMMLETMGFTNVKNLSGGMLAWEAAYGR